MGGLGKSVAAWLAEHDLTNLMFLSRSAGTSTEDQQFFEELKIIGCTMQAFQCDVPDAKATKDAVDPATKPIAGVLQMAMVLHDAV